MKSILLEAVAILAGGVLLAFAANALSPRGLQLTRNYFPKTTVTAPPTPGTTATNHAALASRLLQNGMRLADHNQAVRLFKSPEYHQGQVIFIDARDDAHFSAGHVPGAYQFDYYRPANYLPGVLPACESARQILVYCNGGDCEDSELAAGFLRDAGVPASKLLVYAGGMNEWLTNSLPVETGARNSGLTRPGSP